MNVLGKIAWNVMGIFGAILLLGECSDARSASTAKTKFDLICRGEMAGTSPSPAFREDGPLKIVAHVDLGAGKFCFDTCPSTAQVATSDEGYIDLIQEKVGIRVFRQDGRFIFQRAGLYSAEGKGTCETKAFTGFAKHGF